MRQTPVGGRLVNRVLKGRDKVRAKEAAANLPKIKIENDIIVTLEMIATGVLSPLEGFQGYEDYRSILEDKRLADGTPWTIPQIFAPNIESTKSLDEIKEGEDIALIGKSGEPIALLHLEEKFTIDRKEMVEYIFGTSDKSHPGVNYVYRKGERALAGKIDLIHRPSWGPFEKYRLEPKDTWEIFKERNYETVVGFQTANPLHRGHEYLQKCALEIFDGIFINPIVETTRRAYFRNEFRIKAYEEAIKVYYPEDRVVFAPLRLIMQYAGPREAVMHALIRRNYGCTHFILGRDHAGYKDYYPKYASQKIFKEFEEDELGITPLFFREAFYCARCANLATEKTCPHGKEYHITMSASIIQDIFRYGYLPPKEVMRPEVSQIAIQGIQPKGLDETGHALESPGAAIKGMFPFYITHYRLGGYKRDRPLDVNSLTVADIRRALLDVRINASKIYEEIYETIAYYFDISRDLVANRRGEALEQSVDRQIRLIKTLKEKVEGAPESVQDPFMYQDKNEAKKELDIAQKILNDLFRYRPKDFGIRIWNPLEYERYRHSSIATSSVYPNIIYDKMNRASIEDDAKPNASIAVAEADWNYEKRVRK
jgi:sulfate adenylyltransferase